MDFKTHFQDELAYIKLLVDEYSHEFPELSELFTSASSDPDMIKLFESFAFLTAKSRQKVEDAFPELTQQLLSKIFPLPLRPLPATTILQFTPLDKEVTQLVSKGTYVKCIKQQTNSNGAIQDKDYPFVVCRDTLIFPLNITQTSVTHSQQGTQVTLTLNWFSAAKSSINIDKLTLFLGTHQDSAQLLKLWFSEYLSNIELFYDEQWISMKELKIQLITDKDNCILPIESQQFWRLQLIPEYFSLPHVHDFITLELSDTLKYLLLNHENVLIRFSFNHVFPNDYPLGHEQFQLNCVPAINLFSQKKINIPFTTPYQLVIPDDKYFHAITSLHSAMIKNDKKSTIENEITYLPANQFTAHYHTPENKYLYYASFLNYNVVQEIVVTIAFINSMGESHIALENEYFTLKYQCVSQHVEQLQQGDINKITVDIPSQLAVKNITPPSSYMKALIDSHIHWELLSHLSFSPAFLSDKEAIKALLHDFNFYTYNHSNINNQINGITALSAHSIDWIIYGKPVRGLMLSVSLDGDYFSHIGEMYCFGQLLANVFAFCLTQESFLKVDIIHQKANETWSFEPIFGSKSSI